MISSSLIFNHIILLLFLLTGAGSAFAEEDVDSEDFSEKPSAKKTVEAGVILFNPRKQTKFRFRDLTLNWQLKHPFKVVRATVEGGGAMRINVSNLSEGLRVYAGIAMKDVKFPSGVPAVSAMEEIGLKEYTKKSIVYFSSVMEILGQKGERLVLRTLGTNTLNKTVAVQYVNFECLPAPKVLKCKIDGKVSLSSLGLRAPSLLGVIGDDFVTFWGEADLTPEI